MTYIFSRSLSLDNEINIIIGVLTIAIGILGVLLAWVMWRVARDPSSRRCRAEQILDISICTTESPYLVGLRKPVKHCLQSN